MGHSVVVELNMAAIIRYPLSLGRPSVICPCLWWCRHCCQKKGHEPYTSHDTCCIFCDVLMYYELNLTWSNIYRLILWLLWFDYVTYRTLYIAQSCAFNARSCYIYFLILWPISPDLVTYTARSCDLFHPVLSQIYIPGTCQLYHLILWPIPAMLCPITPDLVTLSSKSCDKYRPILNLLYNMVLILIGFVTYIAQSCDLYRPILWPILPKFPHAYWLMMSDLVTFKSA